MPRTQVAFIILGSLIFNANLGADDSRKETEAEKIAVGPSDWPWWRGPTRDGIAAANQDPPLTWSSSENILWKSPIPGRGHGSPIVVGDRVFLATADPENETQSVFCFDRHTGKQLWQAEVHRASSTPACDGTRVFINFLHAGAIYTTALDFDGRQLWQTKVSDYILHQGFGSSPTVYRSLVLVSADNKGGGTIAALERGTGKVVWKHDRPKFPNYVSPIVLRGADQDQLFLFGCELVSGLDPLTGKLLWETKGSTTECVTSAVTDGKLVFTSGGYPKNHVSAVRIDGSAKIVWENNSRVYVPSMILRNDHLYAVQDDGTAVCWKCDSGKEVWKERLGGTFNSSLVLVGEKIYATNETGKSFIFKATPDNFSLIGQNQLGDDVFATPAICGGRIYMRAASRSDGRRQEMIYCIGKVK
jgi:outer membrane protein assembly factor BamB